MCKQKTDLRVRLGREMDYSDYLRERAAEYRQLAEASGDPTVREDLFESAAICEDTTKLLDMLPEVKPTLLVAAPVAGRSATAWRAR